MQKSKDSLKASFENVNIVYIDVDMLLNLVHDRLQFHPGIQPLDETMTPYVELLDTDETESCFRSDICRGVPGTTETAEREECPKGRNSPASKGEILTSL